MVDEMSRPVADVCGILRLAADGLDGQREPGWQDEVAGGSQQLATQRSEQRSGVLAETAAVDRLPENALRLLDAMRWLDHVCYHCWRASHYLGDQTEANGAEESQPKEQQEPAGNHEADERTGAREDP
jgi:hypothetical protein